MTPSIEKIAAPVLEQMTSGMRQIVTNRVAGLEAQLHSLAQRRDERLESIRYGHWTDEHLQLVFLFNSVYQCFLGPLEAAARGFLDGPIGNRSIRIGQWSLNAETSESFKSATTAFLAIVDRCDVPKEWLYLNTCEQIVGEIANWEETGNLS